MIFMASTLHRTKTHGADTLAPSSAAEHSTVVGLAADEQPTSSGRSPARIALGVFTATLLLVFAATIVLVLALTAVPLVAAIGFAAFCAFWLGVGFGTIFASAAVFGRDH